MRELKFRAWDKHEKRLIGSSEFDGLYSYAESPELNFWLNNPNTVVMQYTGLLDRHGKEIYEGDLVRRNERAKEYKEKWLDEVQEVYWNDEKALFALKGKENWGLIWQMEVIGNIYENPNLLNKLEKDK